MNGLPDDGAGRPGGTTSARLRRQAWLLAIGCALATVAVIGTAGDAAVTWGEFPLDDAWIHQVYARSLALTGVPTYNAGVPDAGFSSPLWLLATVPAQWLATALGSSPVVPAKLISLLFSVLAAVGVGRVAVLLSDDELAGLVAVPVVFLSPAFGFSAFAGMEVTLAVATSAWALVAVFERRALAFGLLGTLAVWARPESALAALPMGIWLLAATWREPRRARRIIAVLGPPVVGGAVWVGFNLVATGHPLPNTFYVKAGAPELGAGVAYLVRSVVLGWFDGDAAGLARLIVSGCLVAIAIGGASLRARSPRAVLVVAAAALPVVAIVATHPLKEGVQYYAARYFYPYTTLLVPFVAVGLSAFARRAGDRRAISAGAAIGALLVVNFAGWSGIRTSYAGHCEEIRRLHTEPARALSELPEDVVIAAEGAGASRYHSGRAVLDLFGLNYAPLAHAGQDNQRRTCLIVNAEPDLLVVPEHWVPALTPAFELAPRAVWSSPVWTVGWGDDTRRVVALVARPRPERVARCSAMALPDFPSVRAP